ncbi:MAG: DNA-binding response regulator [Candidatus Xenobia bacterium]|jgi:DNA-binding response OmpR family regulator
MEKTVLVVEDEEGIREILEMNLIREGYRVVTSETGGKAVDEVKKREPDLILLDLGLPDIDGFEVCRRIRAFSEVPVVMVTAREDDVDKIVGLETGADDYVVKPFNPKELMARVKAILRRVKAPTRTERTQFSYRELTVDVLRRKVFLHQTPVELTPREYDLLTFFISHPGEIFSRQDILREVWGSDHLDARSVDVHVRYLREKLGPVASVYVRTVWGKGYRFGDE